MRQKVTRLERANRSHVDNEELQVQVSCLFCVVVFFQGTYTLSKIV